MRVCVRGGAGFSIPTIHKTGTPTHQKKGALKKILLLSRNTHEHEIVAFYLWFKVVVMEGITANPKKG